MKFKSTAAYWTLCRVIGDEILIVSVDFEEKNYIHQMILTSFNFGLKKGLLRMLAPID